MTHTAADVTEAVTSDQLDAYAATSDLKPVGEPDRGGDIPDEVALRAVFTPGTVLCATSSEQGDKTPPSGVARTVYVSSHSTESVHRDIANNRARSSVSHDSVFLSVWRRRVAAVIDTNDLESSHPRCRKSCRH